MKPTLMKKHVVAEYPSVVTVDAPNVADTAFAALEGKNEAGAWRGIDTATYSDDDNADVEGDVEQSLMLELAGTEVQRVLAHIDSQLRTAIVDKLYYEHSSPVPGQWFSLCHAQFPAQVTAMVIDAVEDQYPEYMTEQNPRRAFLYKMFVYMHSEGPVHGAVFVLRFPQEPNGDDDNAAFVASPSVVAGMREDVDQEVQRVLALIETHMRRVISERQYVAHSALPAWYSLCQVRFHANATQAIMDAVEDQYPEYLAEQNPRRAFLHKRCVYMHSEGPINGAIFAFRFLEDPNPNDDFQVNDVIIDPHVQPYCKVE